MSKAERTKTKPKTKPESTEVTFSSLRDFEIQMFPRELAERSLQSNAPAARALGERLAEALAQDMEDQLPHDTLR